MSVINQEIANMLDGTTWANNLTWEEMQILSGYLQIRHSKINEVIWNEGDLGGSISIIIKGKVKVYKEGKGITELKPGKTFGEMSLFDHGSRSATVVAAEPCTFLYMDEESFEQLSNDNPKLALKITLRMALFLSQIIRGLNGQLYEFLES